jgi:pimeloyl-ACP methyl ester carboxylesterase
MKLSVNGTELFFDVVANARLHIFEHSGHMVFMEEPEELVTVLKEWVTSSLVSRGERR